MSIDVAEQKQKRSEGYHFTIKTPKSYKLPVIDSQCYF